MQTSNFQLGLMATLALGLGLSLSSSDAVGYPAGAAVSYGSNPVVSTGGQLVGAETQSAMSAPVGSNLIVTGIVLSASNPWSACTGNYSVVLDAGGGSLARFVVGLSRPGHSSFSSYDPVSVISLPSGIRVPAGETLQITSVANEASSCEGGNMRVDYTLSGYYAAE
jgi:hypothetical protein